MALKYTEDELDNAVSVLLYASLRGEYTHPRDKKPKLPAKVAKQRFKEDLRVIARVLRTDGNRAKQNSILKGAPRLRQIDIR